jgi:hypothetical protein
MIRALFAAVAAVMFSFAAYAVEVELKDAQGQTIGKVDVTENVVSVAEGSTIADGEYKVTVDGKETTVVFKENKGTVEVK